MAAAGPLEILCLRVQCVKPVAPDAHQNTGESGRAYECQILLAADRRAVSARIRLGRAR